MDEISTILHGCKLARDLQMKVNQLQEMVRGEKNSLLLDSCVEIVNTFTSAIIKLNPQSPLESSDHIVQALIDTPAEILHHHGQPLTMDLMPMGGSFGQEATTDFFPLQKNGGESLAAPAAINVSKSGGRPRRREDRKEKVCLRVPDQGNSDRAPPDGHVWRKYGQKEVLRSKYPRSYYRCTHSKLGCEAKKQVQRADDNYSMFHVTYSGSHTCQTLFKVPSSFDIKQEKSEGEASAQLIEPTSIEFSSIFNVEEFAAGDQQFSHAFVTDHPYQVPSTSMKETGESSGIVKEMDNSVADLVDVMFGSPDTSNSIDTIFSSKN